ncbi:MAG: VIT domain-containing protein [Polyangiaceae bacterium]
MSLGALALAAGIAVWVTQKDGPAEPVIVAATFDNAGPGPREVVLAGGQRTTLDAGARLVERGAGDVELVAGQAVFDARGAKPLAVKTRAGTVTATSTKFWVRASDDAAEVAVARGRASLASVGGDRSDLGAGQEAVMRASGAVTAVVAPRISHLFGFARATNADAVATTDAAPSRKGTLTGRDLTWRREAPLDLRRFDVDVVVEDGFARTTVDQTFFNPRVLPIEGTYAFPLPHGAALSRLAMYVDGKRMEGAVVERSRGRDIYEGIVERRRDPALLEWMGDDTFRMRVFPLPARSEKRIFVSYTTPLEHLYDEERLVVPIPEVDQRAGEARFRVRVVGGAARDVSSPSHVLSATDEGADRILTFDAANYPIGQDLVVTIRGGDGADAARSFEEGGARFVRVATSPALGASARSTASARNGRSVAVLFDVSASRSEEELATQAKFVDGLLDSLDREDRVSILTVGHEAHAMPGGPVAASAIDRAAVAGFLRTESLGAGDSRLDLGLEAATRALAGGGEKEIVYVGDGSFVAVGDANGDAALRGFRFDPETRFIGVAIGDRVDRARLDALANASGGFTLAVGEGEDVAARAFDLVATSYTACVSKIEAEVVDEAGRKVPGAIAELGAPIVCDGERADVIARLPAGAPSRVSVRLRGEASGAPWEHVVDASSAPGGAAYLPRVFAERRVRTLVSSLTSDVEATPIEDLSEADRATVKEVTALATKSFLVTPFTSLLVLENDAMYAEAHLERKAPTGWAVYPSPDTIPVVTEPIGTSPLAADGAWDVLERAPTELFGEPYYAAFRSSRGPKLAKIRMGGVTGSPWSIGERRSRERAGEGFGGSIDAPRRSARLAGAHREWKSTADLSSIGTIGWSRPVSGSFEVSRATDRAGPVSAFVLDPAAPWADKAFARQGVAAFAVSDDPRVADLTEFIPSMFADEFDRVGELLADGVGRVSPTREAAALAVLERALASASPQRYTSADAGTIDGGGAAPLRRVRRLPTGLVERTTLDRDRLVSAYPELGLRTARTPGLATVFFMLREAPMVLPPRSAFEGLDVVSVDDRTIRVRAPRDPGAPLVLADALPAVEIAFDGAGQIVRVTFDRGGERSTVVVERSGNVVRVYAADDAAHATTYDVSAPGPEDPPDGVAYADVDLPLVNPTLSAGPSGGAPERVAHDERQKIASYVALQDDAKVLEHLQALAAVQGKLLVGDVALGSRALRAGSDVARALSKNLGAQDPVRLFVEAKTGAELVKASVAAGDSLVGMLARYRAMLLDLERGPSARFPSELAAFRRAFPGARALLYVLARRCADVASYSNESVVLAAWRVAAADEELAPVADRAIAEQLVSGYSEPRFEEAFTRFVRAMDVAIERGYPIDLDWRDQRILTAARGEVGAEVQITKWRNAILAGGRARQIESLLRVALDPYGGAGRSADLDVGVLVAKLATASDPRDEVKTRVAAMFVERGMRPEAEALLRPLLSRPNPTAAVVELAAVLESNAGDLVRAAGLYERLFEMTARDDLDLDVVRGWYGTLTSIHLRRASLAASPEAEWALRDAFDVAKRWRREDPGNPEVDELCASALDKLGRTSEAEAFAASVVDRAPLLGAAWGQAAAMFQRQGAFNTALAAWSRASAVEPTNPTWLLDRAQALVARGKSGDADEARGLVAKIRKGRFQTRFDDVVYRAGVLESSVLSPREK